MGPKRKASALAAGGSKSTTPSKNSKGSKKDSGGSGQANTLFDFYPNLSKNAPLFRPALAGDDPTPEPLQKSRDAYDCAMATLDAIGSETDNTATITTTTTTTTNNNNNDVSSAFGPFCLDDDEDTSVPHQQAETDTTVASVVASDAASKSNASDDEDSGGVGEEFDMEEEERDRFENGDDEVNEDEAWSWQEYNAEHFGTRVESRDEAVLCPVCGDSIIAFSEHDRSAHVNRCLDLPPPSEQENQVDGVPLVDATVLRERTTKEVSGGAVKQEPPLEHDEAVPCDLSRRVKEEPQEDQFIAVVKAEPTELRIKSELHPQEALSGEEDVKADIKPDLLRGASNAFDKIMVNHSEEKQWADAARTENLQRGTKYKTRVCPFYKILSPFPIAVDAFKYGTVPGIRGYYLTHFHSDHYGGLSSTWDAGPIYCSSITGSLVIQQLRVRPEYVVKLPMNEAVDVNGVRITLIDANHCPGSTLFLFEGTVRHRMLRYLHCGDFRATPTQLLHPAVRGKRLDSLYLDTTYLSPKYAFPSQQDVIEACAHVCCDLAGLPPPDGGLTNRVEEARHASVMSKYLTAASSSTNPPTSSSSLSSSPHGKSKGRLLVVVGTYSIGKERIVVGIAKSLGSKIYAAQRKRDILNCLEDAELVALLTDDPTAAQVHMTYLQEIRAETLLAYMHDLAPHFGRVVGFRGTGWTYTPPKTRFLDSPTVEQVLAWQPRYTFKMMQPGRGSSAVAACYGVPYSEHSSFRELMCFCLSADLGRVIPTVNIGSETSRKKMKAWIDKWAIEVRKNGMRPIKEGATVWC